MTTEEFLLVSRLKSSLAEKKQHPNTETSPGHYMLISPCGRSPDSPYGIDRNFSGTYPPNNRGCSLNLALQESSQKVVFDEVTMTKFSLALLPKQKHLQMRWLPVACEAAGPLLQFWGCGCVTNQVIALGRVHPLHPKRRPPLPAHLGGRGVEKGGPMQVYILVKTQPGAAWHLLQAFQLHSGDLHPEVLKNLCNNKRFLKWAMSVIKYCTVKCFIQQDCSSTGNWTNS